MEALESAIKIVGGVTQLAAHCGVVQGAVSNWKIRKRVPAEYCPRIERATNRQVRCEALRPDVDWGYLREAAGAPDPDAPDSAAIETITEGKIKAADLLALPVAPSDPVNAPITEAADV